jgi:Tfp pilus assembly protein PilV
MGMLGMLSLAVRALLKVRRSPQQQQQQQQQMQMQMPSQPSPAAARTPEHTQVRVHAKRRVPTPLSIRAVAA